MKLTLLLGSGVSSKSIRGSSVQDITKSVLEGDWKRPTGWNSFEDCKTSPEDILRIQRFLSALEKEVKRRLSGYYKRLIQPTYEDLFYCVDQLHERFHRGIVNPLLEDFGLRFEAKAAEFVYPVGTDISYSLKNLYDDAANFIRCVVWRKLILGSPGEDFGFLTALAGHAAVDQLDILTLNHDLLIEQRLKAAPPQIQDGFGIPDGKLHWLQDQIPVPQGREAVRLCKLHGSVNWFETSSRGARRLFRAPDDLAMVEWTDAEGQQLYFTNPPVILAGSYNKLDRYHEEPFSYMFRFWNTILSTTSTLLVSGYGFGDSAVNLSLFNWMRGDSARRLLVFHENPDDLKGKARHWDVLSTGDWEKQGRWSYRRNWIGELSADRILDQVAQSGAAE